TFSDQANEDGLQLRWAIGKVLHDAMPEQVPDFYIEFARRLNTSDRVLTLNYDILLERALHEVGLPFRRFPTRYSEVFETHAIGLYAYMLGGFSVIGCSLPRGDPYVTQLIHHIATDYASGRPKKQISWPQPRMKVVDLCADQAARVAVHDRYRFFDPDQTTF